MRVYPTSDPCVVFVNNTRPSYKEYFAAVEIHQLLTKKNSAVFLDTFFAQERIIRVAFLITE